MHSSNPKVRNSPSGNTQSSPKSKQEVMVRPPTVMSPSGNPQLDSKFSNQGGSMGLKNGAGNGAKGKGKRERSISADSFDQRDPGTPNDDSDIKECNSTDHIKSQDSHTPHSMTPSTAVAPRSSTPSHGQTTAPEPTPAQKTPAKVVYVFSTEMANKAAEAVLKGQVETIVSFHIQNISNSKTERSTAPLNTQIPALRNDPKPLPQQPQAPANQDQNSAQNTRLQPTPPIPAPAPKPAVPPRPLDQESPGVDNKLIPPVGSPASTTPLPPDGTAPNSTPNNRAVTPVSQGSSSSSADPKAPPPPPVSGGEPPTLGENPDGLSQEQLEHRERSLQTLRDIQRMLFPDEKEFTGAQSGGPPQNPGVLDGPQKKPEGPIQAMMAQSQSLGKGPGSRTDVGAPFGPQGPRDVPFSPEDMVPPPLNSDHLDHMTPEQIAWLKLQQEFYEEKRRKQEQVVVQQCSLQDMMAHQHGPRGVVRGPPPPYQMAPGDGWAPGGAEPFPDGISLSHSLPPRGMAPHPSMPGGQMRLPAFAGMMNSDLEGPGVPGSAPRPGLSGVSWPDEVAKIPGDGRNFPPGQGVFSGPGRGERFPNPQGLSEEMFQQQLAEKQLGLPPGMSMEGIRPGLDVNRMVPGSQRHLEPGNNPIFPRGPAEGPLSPSRGDFPKGMAPQLGPGRELEFGLVPAGLKGDVSLNVSMASGAQMIPQKMREAGAGPEDMMKLRQGSSELLPGQQKMVPLPFGEHPQPEYGLGPRPFLPLAQGPGSSSSSSSSLRNLREAVGPDQRTNSRLSHVPPLPLNPSSNPTSLNPAPAGQRGLGRKPLDISVAGSQVHSPGMNPLKSPTMHQVQSPMLGSPSGNLKSPQTPSQLAGMLAGPAAAASIKSPPVLGSAAASPVHLKSPSLPAPSPGWTSSPKPPLQSPGIPPNHKAPLTMTSPAMLGSVESGGPPAPPAASQPASVNIPGSLPSSTPYTMPPEPTLSQNPLSIMMSRMSKFAMPSSTPLYHDAIKTVASSDDDSPPARSPNLPSMNNMPGPNPVVPMPTLSPMGMTQPLSHSNQMPSPGAMGPGLPPHGVPVGPGLIAHNAILGHGAQEPAMGPQGRMGFPQGFPPVQSPPQQVLFPHNGPSGGQGGFPGGMGFPGEGPLGRPGNLAQGSADAALCKPGGPDSFAVLGNSMPSVFTDPELQEVIRPGAAGIPEFDLSRIIPSEKPSQTLQYFPRAAAAEAPGRKPPPPPPPPGPGFAHMPGVMGEQAPRMGLALPGMGGPGPVGTADLPLGTAPAMPGHSPMRPPAFLQQGMMGPHARMMSPAPPAMPGQPALMSNPAAAVGMIAAGKDRGPAGLYSHPGPVGSPGMVMSMQGMMGPQQSLMIPPQMRPRGMAADVGMGGFSQGPGNPGNMMF
ncbi:B-cell CLL/lymphoma 9 protein isoform X2 [Dipodomys merriami]|uniref:B-cell CLL/lymphoma 9 protein isoform X2 n=1 Tax=Dipodomys merriami TaxID=94247 RepID=UPI0038558206